MAENSESAVLRAIAELEALDEPDHVDEIVLDQLKGGWLRENTGSWVGLDWYGNPRPDGDFWSGMEAWIVQLYQDVITEALTGIPPLRLDSTTPVRLRRISPVTGQPYPPEADTRALRPVWDSRMRPYSALFADILGDADLTLNPTPWRNGTLVIDPPVDAPYRAHVQLEPGDRVGWDNGDGIVHTGIVEDHQPTGRPGEWTITIGDPPAPHTPGILGLIREALVALGRWLR